MGKEQRKTEDYEESEEIAITSGKEALLEASWLSNRNTGRNGFFVQLKYNDQVHPNHYAVHCVDGVGTKLFFAPWSGNYRLQMQDGIAMNANDMATMINAYPDAVDLYMACQTEVEEKHMGDIIGGVVDALEKIRVPDAPFDVNIGKLETASLDEMISLGIQGKGFDVGIVMTGFIEKSKIPNLDPTPGDIIVGVASTGLHSNGFTGARHVLLTPDVEYRDEWKSQYKGRFSLKDKPEILQGKTVLEALQVPTALYLKQSCLIGQIFEDKRIYGINITGNGLHNFNRAGRAVSFEITNPLPMLPIHKLLIQESGWNPQTAYKKQNMGMGFAYIVPNLALADDIVDYINKTGEQKAQIVGEVRQNTLDILETTLHKPYEGKKLDFIGYAN